MDIKKLIRESLLNEDKYKDIFRGWVNIKSDMQINERIGRLMQGLGFDETGPEGLLKKIRFLSQPTHGMYDRSLDLSQQINRNISVIMITAFLKELSDRRLFDPSSSGFLFEPFIAGLLGETSINGTIDLPTDQSEDSEVDGAGVVRDYGKTDVRDSEGNTYQCKLYGKNTDINIVKRIKDTDDYIVLIDREDYPEYFVIGYKEGTAIEIYVIETELIKEKIVRPRYEIDRVEDGKNIWRKTARVGKQNLSYKDVVDLSGKKKRYYTINLGQNFDSVIDTLLENLTSNVERIWSLVSDLHVNIEAMMTGMSSEGTFTKFTNAGGRALKNSHDLGKQIKIFQKELEDSPLNTSRGNQLGLF